MVAKSFAPGASVSKVAQRYGVNANLLFTWGRQEGRSNAVAGAERLQLFPVMVAQAGTPAEAAATQSQVGRMEMASDGGRMRFFGLQTGAVVILFRRDEYISIRCLPISPRRLR